MKSDEPNAFETNRAAWRWRDHGVAVARVAARLGANDGRAPRRRVPEALCRAVHGQRHQRQPLVGPRQRRRDEIEQLAGAARAAQDEDQRDQRPVQQARRRHGHSPRTDGQSALGRADSEGRDHQGGDHDGSGPRQPRRPGHAAPQHRPRLRAADDRLPRDEFLDGLQLAHLVAKRGVAGPERGLPVAGVRQPVRESRQPALSEHPRPGERSRRDPEPSGERNRQSQAGRIPDQRSRGRDAHRAHARGERHRRRSREAQEPATCSRWSGRRTGCPRICASTRG